MPRKRLPGAKPWYASGLHFTCTGCGQCCTGPESGYVFVDEDEILAMAAALELDVDTFGARYLRMTPDGAYSLTERPDNLDCVFWVEEVGCQVYEARPTQCRTYPFWPEVVESREAWEEEAESCPGIEEGGERYTRARIERIVSGGDETPMGPGGPESE